MRGGEGLCRITGSRRKKGARGMQFKGTLGSDSSKNTQGKGGKKVEKKGEKCCVGERALRQENASLPKRSSNSSRERGRLTGCGGQGRKKPRGGAS